jgi:hypothetical protein
MQINDQFVHYASRAGTTYVLIAPVLVPEQLRFRCKPARVILPAISTGVAQKCRGDYRVHRSVVELTEARRAGAGEAVEGIPITGVCVAAGVATGTGSVSVNNRGAIGIGVPHADNVMTKVSAIESFSTFENTSLLQSQNEAL